MDYGKEKTVLTKRNSSVSFALECALLFLAIFVFSWGLHAKLSLYHADQGTSSVTNSMAKLSAETRTIRSSVSVEDKDPPCFALESLHFSALVFTLQGNRLASAKLVQVEAGPRIPGQYYLHGPDLKRRPPPVSS